MIATDCPYGQFFDLDGTPLSAGKAYYGVAGQNPITSPIAVYWDAAGTQPAAQPVATINGYLSRSGTPALVFCSSAYSLLVLNKRGQTVYYLPDSSALPSALGTQLSATNAANTGVGLVGYSQLLAYTSPSAGYRMRQTFSARNAGCDDRPDDVSADLATHIAAAAAVGADFEFTAGQTYKLGSALTFPSGMTIRTKGAVFEDINGTTSNTYFIVLGPNSRIDSLKVSIPAGKQRDRPVLIGTGCTVGYVSVVSADQQAANTDLNDAAITIASASDVVVGQAYVQNHDRPYRIDASQNVVFSKMDAVSYVRGCWIHDSSNVRVLGGHMRTASPNASITAGHNGFLISCDTAGTSYDITVEGVRIADAGEHAIRIGGPESQRNIRIVKPSIKSPGACGIKIRGSDGVTSIYNYNVTIDNAIIEDCGTSTTASKNRCGILAEWCAGVQIIAPVIRPRDNTYCASFGIRVNACNDCSITSPTIHAAQYDNLLFDADESDISRGTVVGGVLYNAGRNGLGLFTSATMTARNIHVSGALAQGCANFGFLVSNGGALSDVNVAFRSHNNTAGAVSCSSSAVVLQVAGLPGATPKASVVAADGSTWLDNSAGNFYVLKAGTWTAAA